MTCQPGLAPKDSNSKKPHKQKAKPLKSTEALSWCGCSWLCCEPGLRQHAKTSAPLLLEGKAPRCVASDREERENEVLETSPLLCL